MLWVCKEYDQSQKEWHITERSFQMNNQATLSIHEPKSGKLKTHRYQGLLDIIAVYIPLAVCAYIGHRLDLTTVVSGLVINLGYALSIAVASVVLKLRGMGWSEIGLARPRSWPRTLLFSLAAVVGAIVVISVVTIVVTNLPGTEIAVQDISRFNPLTGNLTLLLGLLVLAWTTIAFGEEMFYRAFLTCRLADVFRNTRMGWALAALGSSAAFGLAHYGEGISGIFSNGAFGLLFALIYLRTGRNLWILIIAHGILNSLRFVIIYLA
jgi:membrane protease YdiL (CAAX protease family)